MISEKNSNGKVSPSQGGTSTLIEIVQTMRRYNIEGHPKNFNLVFKVLQGYDQPLREAFIELGNDKNQSKLDALIEKFLPEEAEAENVAARSIDSIGNEIESLIESINLERTALIEYRKVLSETSNTVDGSGDLSPHQLREMMSAISLATQQKIAVGDEVTRLVKEQTRRVENVSAQLNQFKEEKFKDPLTRLANRRAYNRRMVGLYQEDTNSMVVSLKVDSNSLIKARFGAIFLDKIAMVISEILQAECDEAVFISHLGDGDFGLILRQESVLKTVYIAEAVRQSFFETANTSTHVNQIAGRMSVSAGIVDSRHSSSPGELNQKLELALQKASADGGNKSFYLDEAPSSDTDVQAPERFDLMMYAEV